MAPPPDPARSAACDRAPRPATGWSVACARERRELAQRGARICAGLDAGVERFRTRALGETALPCLWLDATYLKVREAGRVVSMAALVATDVAPCGALTSG
ncbi:MAG TPA: transposase [Candidatus Limnocylindria bacterium]|nr:transposase [Candidatus Limnocylindria bacterium]